jgi:hypothetical protein
MTIEKAYIHNRKDGDTTFCYGELNEGDNIQITLDNGTDGIAGDIDVTVLNQTLGKRFRILRGELFK